MEKLGITRKIIFGSPLEKSGEARKVKAGDKLIFRLKDKTMSLVDSSDIKGYFVTDESDHCDKFITGIEKFSQAFDIAIMIAFFLCLRVEKVAENEQDKNIVIFILSE